MKRYIGTFHKTGTALFGSILRQAKREGLLNPWFFHEEDEPEKWDIGFANHSQKLFEEFDSDPNRARYVIAIRDPRDVIVSAAYFHQNANEEWLHKPRKDFGGLTYQEKINSYPSSQDKFLFEMENSSGHQIRSMLRIPFGAESLQVTRLEELVTDNELREFHKIFSFLRLEVDQTSSLLQIAYENSIFSGKVKKSIHVRSGKPRQYKVEFSAATMARYKEMFGDAAERLGYEAD